MMHYTNRDQFIVSAPGCMRTDPDSLESIMAGNEGGANGCTLPLDMTRDGIAVLCSNSGFRGPDGTFHAVGEADYVELRRFFPKIVAVGQAIELAKSCAAKICVELKNPTVCPQVKIALSHADYLDNAYFGGLDPAAAAAAAHKNPALHIMADLPGAPPDAVALIRAAQEAGLFGLRGAPEALTDELCEEALRCGLFLASTECSNFDTLESLMARGVNFIETARPDLAFALLPQVPDEG
ncbi:MAG: hypothetical protein ACI3XZ_01045 [Butyricicoccus sp.]